MWFPHFFWGCYSLRWLALVSVVNYALLACVPTPRRFCARIQMNIIVFKVSSIRSVVLKGFKSKETACCCVQKWSMLRIAQGWRLPRCGDTSAMYELRHGQARPVCFRGSLTFLTRCLLFARRTRTALGVVLAVMFLGFSLWPLMTAVAVCRAIHHLAPKISFRYSVRYAVISFSSLFVFSS